MFNKFYWDQGLRFYIWRNLSLWLWNGNDGFLFSQLRRFNWFRSHCTG